MLTDRPTADSRIARAAAALRAETDRRTLDAADDLARDLRAAGHPRNLNQLREGIRSEAQRQNRVARQRAEARELGEDPVRSAIRGRYQQCEIEADPAVRRAVRRVAGIDDHDAVPVVVVWGCDQPQVAGRSYIKYHWRNGPASGTVYHPSTRRLEVGVGWLHHHLPILMAQQRLSVAA